jgi:hypothetical protein
MCFQMGGGLYPIVLTLNLVVQGQDELVKAQVLGKFTHRLQENVVVLLLMERN